MCRAPRQGIDTHHQEESSQPGSPTRNRSQQGKGHRGMLVLMSAMIASKSPTRAAAWCEPARLPPPNTAQRGPLRSRLRFQRTPFSPQTQTHSCPCPGGQTGRAGTDPRGLGDSAPSQEKPAPCAPGSGRQAQLVNLH